MGNIANFLTTEKAQYMGRSTNGLQSLDNGNVEIDDLFMVTYLPYADETTRSMFRAVLTTVRCQNEIIERQMAEIEHKEDVIIGLVECDALENRDFSTAPQIYGTANGGHSTRKPKNPMRKLFSVVK